MGFEQALSGLYRRIAEPGYDRQQYCQRHRTIGFKRRARGIRRRLCAASLGGATATQIGIGTAVAAISPQFTQGNITTTGNPLDVAINGGGFFREVEQRRG